MSDILLILLIVMTAALLFLAVILLLRQNQSDKRGDTFARTYGEILSKNQQMMAEQQDARLRDLGDQMARMREENGRQLELMRRTVHEKLDETLETRLTRSFSLVNERLEQVYRGLGEMQSMARNVGDLKKILSNVKTRGILGEMQLGSILEQILAPEQYETNVATRPGSRERVEFAIRLPGSGDGEVLLPIDAKFPGDAYQNLLDAYDRGDRAEILEKRKVLMNRILSEAKDIATKYIAPPYTTDFAVLFLPFEGLYSEAVQAGMVELLQRRYKVMIAGPTTTAALLNSLQMGFRTLAIEKRSSEVWQLLGAVRTEFDTFEEVLENTQRKLNQANNELDKLVGVRTRQIRRKLQKVTALESEEAKKMLEDE